MSATTEPVLRKIEPSGRKRYHRSIKELRDVLSMLCNFIWTRQLRPGEHLWSIPVDQQRDFDCLLSDAIDELEGLREWQPIETAPRDTTWVIGQMADDEVRRVHWASDLSGSDQPAFQGWFYRNGNGFVECNPVRWTPEPQRLEK